jgi:hypothetical protein
MHASAALHSCSSQPQQLHHDYSPFRCPQTCVQVQQLGAALAEFERLSHDHKREGSLLLSSANKPGWMFAEAAQQAGKSSAAGTPESSTSAAAAASTSASAVIDTPAAAAAKVTIKAEAGQAATVAAAGAADEAAGSSAAAAAGAAVEAAGSSAAAAATATGGSSAAVGRAGLDRLLGRHVNSRLLHMISLHMLIANTLTRLQLARMLVRTAAGS